MHSLHSTSSSYYMNPPTYGPWTTTSLQIAFTISYVSSSTLLCIGIIHLTTMVVLVKLPSNTTLHWLLPKASTVLRTLQHISTIRQTLLNARANFPRTRACQSPAAIRSSRLMIHAGRLDLSPVKHFSNMTSNGSRQTIKDPHKTRTHDITSPGAAW
jgi:hypothetical protein